MHNAGNTRNNVDNTENPNKILTHSYSHKASKLFQLRLMKFLELTEIHLKKINQKKKMYSFIIK